jgi:hypothetical protein
MTTTALKVTGRGWQLCKECRNCALCYDAAAERYILLVAGRVVGYEYSRATAVPRFYELAYR